jgi:hypothetical protein
MENSTAASYGNNLSMREPVFSTPSGTCYDGGEREERSRRDRRGRQESAEIEHHGCRNEAGGRTPQDKAKGIPTCPDRVGSPLEKAHDQPQGPPPR